MAYAGLGARSAQGTSTDNISWTITFDPSVLSVSTAIPYFEVYHSAVTGVPGSTFNRYIESWLWDTGVYGNSNTDDPNEPVLMQPGQTLTFKYVYPAADLTPPMATIWLRYDESLLSASGQVTGLCRGSTVTS